MSEEVDDLREFLARATVKNISVLRGGERVLDKRVAWVGDGRRFGKKPQYRFIGTCTLDRN